MLEWIELMGVLSFITGLIDPIGKIGEQLAEAYAKQQDQLTERERIKNDFLIEQMQMRQALLLEEQKHRLTRWIRPAFAYPLAFYLGKIWVWDKALGWGASDPVDENLLWVMTAIISFYFVSRPIEKVFSIRRKD